MKCEGGCSIKETKTGKDSVPAYYLFEEITKDTMPWNPQVTPPLTWLNSDGMYFLGAF
jgi:hypothetical protein